MTVPTREAVLEFVAVTKTYPGIGDEPPATALPEFSLSVGAAELVVVSGRSGSGKTTMLQLGAALLPPTRGQVRWDGRDVATITDADLSAFRREQLGIIFQDAGLISTLTPRRTSPSPPTPTGSGGTSPARAQPNCSHGSGSAIAPTTCRASSPAASASASPSPAPCSPNHACSSSTSPPPASTDPAPPTSSHSFAPSPTTGPPSSSPATTQPSPRRATASTRSVCKRLART